MIGVTGATGFIGKHLMNALGDSAIPINMRDDDKDIMNLLMENNIKIIIHLANPTPSINQDDVGKKGIELGERIVDIADSIGEIYFNYCCAK